MHRQGTCAKSDWVPLVVYHSTNVKIVPEIKDECVVLTGHAQGGAIAAVAGEFMKRCLGFSKSFSAQSKH